MKRALLSVVAIAMVVATAASAATFLYDPPPENGTVSYDAPSVDVPFTVDPPAQCVDPPPATSTVGGVDVTVDVRQVCIDPSEISGVTPYDAAPVDVPYTHDPPPRDVTVPDNPPPPSGDVVNVTDRTWVCDGPVNLDLVKVTISPSVTTRTDAVRLASGCTGRIGRIEVDTWNADGIHIGAFAHDLIVGGGYVTVHDRCGAGCDGLHADVIQVLGGQRITFQNVAVELQYAEGTNSALYINCGQSCQDRPTDVVFESSTFKRSPTRNRTVRIGNSLRSGIRNSTVYWCGTGSQCDAPGAAGIVVMDSATDPVNENNTLILAG